MQIGFVFTTIIICNKNFLWKIQNNFLICAMGLHISEIICKFVTVEPSKTVLLFHTVSLYKYICNMCRDCHICKNNTKIFNADVLMILHVPQTTIEMSLIVVRKGRQHSSSLFMVPFK